MGISVRLHVTHCLVYLLHDSYKGKIHGTYPSPVSGHKNINGKEINKRKNKSRSKTCLPEVDDVVILAVFLVGVQDDTAVPAEEDTVCLLWYWHQLTVHDTEHLG